MHAAEAGPQRPPRSKHVLGNARGFAAAATFGGSPPRLQCCPQCCRPGGACAADQSALGSESLAFRNAQPILATFHRIFGRL